MYFKSYEMEWPNSDVEEMLNQWMQSGSSWALYRMPWADECCWVCQYAAEVEELESVSLLTGKKGFVMAPFRPSSTRKLVLIQPDITARGWTEIARVLAGSTLHQSAVSDRGRADGLQEAGPEVYRQAFGRFIQPLCEGRFSKLVLSRASEQPIPQDFSLLRAFVKACRRYPRMMVYLCHTPVTGTWMGSTPEILLSGEGHGWHTVALAGTMPMQGEVMPTDWSLKNREEQAYVARYIREVLSPYSSELTEEGPYTSRAGQLVHLKSDFRFHLNHSEQLGELLDALHPTPAVCGLPKQEAYDFILEHEGYDRRYYAGFVGWLNPEGHTDLYVNLRCMEVFPHRVRLYAGGGILPQSSVASEWQETEEKMKTMLCLLESDEEAIYVS